MFPSKELIKSIPINCTSCKKKISPFFIAMHETIGSQQEFIDNFGEKIMIMVGCTSCGECSGMTLKKYFEVTVNALNSAINQTIRD